MSEPRHWCWSQSSRTGLLSSHCVRREILGWVGEQVSSSCLPPTTGCVNMWSDFVCILWSARNDIIISRGKDMRHWQIFHVMKRSEKKCMRTDSKSRNGEIDENTWQDVLMKWIEMCTVAALISRWGESARETLTIFYLSYPVDLNFSDKDKNKMTLITVSIPLPCEVLPEMLQILTNRVLENP